MAERDRGRDASLEVEIDTSDMRSRFEPPLEPDLPLVLEEQRAPPPPPPPPPPTATTDSQELHDLSNPDLVRPPPRVIGPPRRGPKELAQASVASFRRSPPLWIAIGAAAVLLVGG